MSLVYCWQENKWKSDIKNSKYEGMPCLVDCNSHTLVTHVCQYSRQRTVEVDIILRRRFSVSKLMTKHLIIAVIIWYLTKIIFYPVGRNGNIFWADPAVILQVATSTTCHISLTNLDLFRLYNHPPLLKLLSERQVVRPWSKTDSVTRTG